MTIAKSNTTESPTNKRLDKIKFDVIGSAYDWSIDIHGNLLGLTAGDHGYEETGIQLSGVTLSIWGTWR